MLARARGAASEAESIMSMMRKCFAAGQAARDKRKKKAAEAAKAAGSAVTAPGAVAYGVVAGAKGQQVIKAYAKPPPKPAPAKQPAGTPAGPAPTPPAPDPVDPKAFVVDHQHLVYMHIATVVKPEANQLVMLETASPTGIFIRYRDTLLDPTVWFGRLPVPIGPGPPNLSAYLERSRLVDAARLDD